MDGLWNHIDMTLQQMQALDCPAPSIPSSGLTPKQFERMLADAKAVRMVAMVNARAALKEAHASHIDRRRVS